MKSARRFDEAAVQCLKPHAAWICLMAVAAIALGAVGVDATAATAVVTQQPPASQPAEKATPPKEKTGEQGEAIKRLIERKLSEQPTASARPQIITRKLAEEAANQAAASQPAGKSGCGGGTTAIDLTPPPLDAPQPHWVCEKPEVEIEPVWRGKTAEFVFKVSNSGEGVLNVRIKGG